MLEEHIFLNEKDVIVSNVRFSVNDEETYAISGLVYVKLEEAKRKIRYVPFFLGCFLAIGGLVFAALENLLGMVVLLVGLIVMAAATRKSPHGIEIKTTAGESQFYSDRNGDFVQKVFRALNDAIIFRG